MILVPSQKYQDSIHLLQNPKVSRNIMGFNNCAQRFTGSNYLVVDNPFTQCTHCRRSPTPLMILSPRPDQVCLCARPYRSPSHQPGCCLQRWWLQNLQRRPRLQHGPDYYWNIPRHVQQQPWLYHPFHEWLQPGELQQLLHQRSKIQYENRWKFTFTNLGYFYWWFRSYIHYSIVDSSWLIRGFCWVLMGVSECYQVFASFIEC